MRYLSGFTFPNEDQEWAERMSIKPTFYQTMYPFYILPEKGMEHISFDTITILYGGNGSGKSTVLNVIAEKLGLERNAPYNRSPFFERYTELCSCDLDEEIPPGSRIITSDDVFDAMLGIREINQGIDREKEKISEEYFRLKKEKFQLRSLDDYEHLERICRARSKTMSRFTEGETGKNIRERSNGESADLYFREKMESDTLCLLDEPENSLSPENQIKLAAFLAEAARYLGNQLVISTHSPFILSLPGARIIDMDNGCRVARSWTELKNVRVYYDFFRGREAEFRNED